VTCVIAGVADASVLADAAQEVCIGGAPEPRAEHGRAGGPGLGLMLE
jgi:hypothetical protein